MTLQPRIGATKVFGTHLRRAAGVGMLAMAGCVPQAPAAPAAPEAPVAVAPAPPPEPAFRVGEAFEGTGVDVAHVEVLIGDKSGPVGTAFANSLANQTIGHGNLLVVLSPNVAVKPSTVAVPKVTINNSEQGLRFYGPAQRAIAEAVTESVAEGVIPEVHAEDWAIVVGVFIHFEAKDDAKIFVNNKAATKLAIERAMNRQPTTKDVAKTLESVIQGARPEATPPQATPSDPAPPAETATPTTDAPAPE
jgi:5,6,7,8-tetrahydromethanopterin hydro-lyase